MTNGLLLEDKRTFLLLSGYVEIFPRPTTIGLQPLWFLPNSYKNYVFQFLVSYYDTTLWDGETVYYLEEAYNECINDR